MIKKSRKVVLNMKEEKVYKTIKDLSENKINKHRAALILNYSNVHINRLLRKYKSEGKSAFSHDNKGRKPSTTILNKIKNNIINLYNEKYFNFNISHFSEMLKEFENISVSIPTIISILRKEFIISPKSQRKTKRELIKEIEIKEDTTRKKKEITKLKQARIRIENSHIKNIYLQTF